MDNKKILVVEDNPLNMKLVRSLLHLGKYQVLETDDGEKGLEMVREHRPDLVLMDIQLPGINGLEVTRQIRKDPVLGDTPVVALTSYAMDGDDKLALDAGCAGYVTKPIDTRTFLKTIQNYLPSECKTPPPAVESGRKYLPKILIVDDEPLNTKLLAAQIPRDQYSVICTHSGQEAIEKAEEILPELILLDIMMPQMDGYEATRQLKAKASTSRIPIILITALQGTEDKIKGLEAGAEDFLSKPVNTVELLARINSMLRLKRYGEQLANRMQSEEQIIGGRTNSSQLEARENCEGNILLVEDNEKDINLIKGHLRDQSYEIFMAESGEDAIEIVRENDVDLILLDILLPGMDGFEVCQKLRGLEKESQPQVVMITCLDDLDSKIKGVELGVDDFLIKPINGRELRARIKSLLKKKKYLDRLQSHYKLALHSAIMDGLTGLYNHAYFKQALEIEIKKSVRQDYPTALMMLDLDNFKHFNDTYGHTAGDVILSEIAGLFRACVRETDLVARYGGEEFSIVLPYAGRQETLNIADRILQSVRNHQFVSSACSVIEPITVSGGIALCPSDAHNAPDLIQKADAMLYQAKKSGKDRVQVY